jgi:prepilin-type N-terminal cleavage/methylation domain-containing protein
MRDARGFTLVEVVISAGLLATLAAGGAHLIGRAVRDADAARVRTVATVAALQKMEQLRALGWGVESDSDTDLASDLPSAGGTGLGPSPPGTLDDDVPGYVDYLTGDGVWLSGTSSASAVFARRWSVGLHPHSANTLTLRVVVTRARGPIRRTAGVPALVDVEQVTYRTRFQP